VKKSIAKVQSTSSLWSSCSKDKLL